MLPALDMPVMHLPTGEPWPASSGLVRQAAVAVVVGGRVEEAMAGEAELDGLLLLGLPVPRGRRRAQAATTGPGGWWDLRLPAGAGSLTGCEPVAGSPAGCEPATGPARKSTRLHSSHVRISYAA